MKKLVCLLMALMLMCTAFVSVSAADEKVKVAFVGDSITYGATLTDASTESFAAIIKEKVGADYEVMNFGKSSKCALSTSLQPYTATEEYSASIEFEPDILFIMLGTNDIKNENWDEGKDNFVADYLALIDSYRKAKPDLKVYVGIPPRIFKENVYGTRSPEILEKEGIPAIYEVAEQAEAMVIDFFEPIKEKGELFPDFLHPNAEGHKVFADIAYNAMFVDEFEPYVSEPELPKPELPVIDDSQITDNESDEEEFNPEGASDWAKEEIKLAYEANLLPESVMGSYKQNITRKEFCEMVVKMLPENLEAQREAAFTDCDNEAVDYAYSVGVVNGMSDSEFAPDAEATRQEMATMLFRAYKLIVPSAAPSIDGDYPDKAQIASWALDSVNFMNEKGIMKGDAEKNIMPLKNTTREEAILLVYRAYSSANNQ
ncbi:MAG: S-layer homology domain-containing protein [Clostridia bacterium]|nr:S-layer homology domain-containing protein [Clostridia bacterium]